MPAVRGRPKRNRYYRGEALPSDVAREHRSHEKATQVWHELMRRAGRKQHTVTADDPDTLPKRIGPASVPMGGSSLGDV